MLRAMTRSSAGAAQQDRSLANPDRAFELDRGVGGGDPVAELSGGAQSLETPSQAFAPVQAICQPNATEKISCPKVSRVSAIQ